MKVGQDNNFKGSFGIPQHMRAALEQSEKAKQEGLEPPQSERPSVDGDMPQAYADEGFDTTDEPASATKDTPTPLKDPLQVLKEEYNIELTSDDIQRIIFKGYTEKDATVIPSIMGSQPLVATFKTLTGTEYELADEMLAEEIRDVRMTNDGFSTRRGMWLLAYGLKKIQGKLYYTPKFLDDAKKVLDKKGTLNARKDKLGDFSPVVLAKMMAIQSDLTIAVNYIFSHDNGEIVKKP